MGMIQTHWRATRARRQLGERAVPVQGADVAQLLVRSPRPDHYVDEGHEALAGRIRRLVRETDVDVDRCVPLARMYRAANDGPLRTMSGALPHENGWIPLHKAKGLAHWQGVAQRGLLVRGESDFSIERIASESVALEFPYQDGTTTLTFDVETWGADGTRTVWEVKRDERDLADRDYRHALAIAAEIFRRCGIGFGVIFRDEIFTSRVHRANAEIFAARAFVRIDRKHVDRLENAAIRRGPRCAYGELAEALEPDAPNFGAALVQALAVRRRVEIDLTGRLHADTPLNIH
ncbi:hypothetical protein SR41_16945 [Sphingomonas melonis]|uniref:TnsA endonuclease N-terminal domain-containing protein n=1 Tax=Sphingomonas melonis TaxID=152682 RepID=A0A0D1M260_9SPHN|nr:hypothetical protein [Sphingomonas melonis]KIU26040.1 hypothetical protein SR41_16945 [Sphingomonas melonis]